MHISGVIPRSGSKRVPPEQSCEKSASWFKWCPVDVTLWVIAWRVGTTKLRKKKDAASTSKSRKIPLSVPYPQSPTYNKYDCEPKRSGDDSAANATLLDPYHVVNTLDDSLISKDDSFKRAAVPAPVKLKKNRSYTPSKLGRFLSIASRSSGTRSSPLSVSPVVSEEATAVENPATPPPAYIHNKSPSWSA
ncbi:hypothetical protein B0H34DRAFT_844631 [Crassisporium funariophilum]|nr:hypothetical protein B0H34DRAFT_844631 [Crassisporium funariophilum]